jgi:hypothetical protein
MSGVGLIYCVLECNSGLPTNSQELQINTVAGFEFVLGYSNALCVESTRTATTVSRFSSILSRLRYAFGAILPWCSLMIRLYYSSFLITHVIRQAKISIGDPDLPISAVNRDKKVFTPLNETHSDHCLDHDFHSMSITPSITQIPVIPTDVSDTFYNGQVFYCLKCSIQEASSPARHSAELVRTLRLQYPEVPPFLCIYTDGGPDHRSTYSSVQVSKNHL